MSLLGLRMGAWRLGDGSVLVGTNKMQRVEADRCCQSVAIHGNAASSLDLCILGTIISLGASRMSTGRSCVLTPSLGVSRGLELRSYVALVQYGEKQAYDRQWHMSQSWTSTVGLQSQFATGQETQGLLSRIGYEQRSACLAHHLSIVAAGQDLLVCLRQRHSTHTHTHAHTLPL